MSKGLTNCYYAQGTGHNGRVKGDAQGTGRSKAFTLIEMIIVIAIISTLLGLLYGALERAQKFSRRTITYTELKTIEAAMKQYHAHYKAWPTNLFSTLQLYSSSQGGVGQDYGFIIDDRAATLLRGAISSPRGSSISRDDVLGCNSELLPFLELSRVEPRTGFPVNPFKPLSTADGDVANRAYRVLFDTNGDRQLYIQETGVQGFQPTNIIADVAVWTVIPGTRRTTAGGAMQERGLAETVFGSWQTFAAGN